jgi:hypothetical protein
MKRYYIRIPRDYTFYTCVEAEDSREARFEAVKTLVFKALHEFVPLDIDEGETVYPCDGCTSFFPSGDLSDLDGKMLCCQCEAVEHGAVPDYW